MFIDKHREVITSDLFDINRRIKSIDRDYFIVRNHTENRFEIHNKGQIGSTFCLVVPFDRLDQRTVKLVKESRIEYIDNIINEMERNNKKLEEDAKKKRDDLAHYVGKEMHSYLTKYESKETIDKDSTFLKGVI